MHGGPWTDPVTGYLERSLEADPDHLPATLALIEQNRTADSPKDWHRATDLAAKRFPGNTAILLQAVDRRWRAVPTRKPWASRGGC